MQGWKNFLTDSHIVLKIPVSSGQDGGTAEGSTGLRLRPTPQEA